jgi:hypothetical protein
MLSLLSADQDRGDKEMRAMRQTDGEHHAQPSSVVLCMFLCSKEVIYVSITDA